MALEDKIDNLIAAVNKLEATIASGGGSTGGKTTGGGGKAGAGKGAADKPTLTADTVKAAILKVKEEKGDDAAKSVIAKAMGKSGAKLAELLAAAGKFQKAMDAAEEALNASDEAEAEEEDEL